MASAPRPTAPGRAGGPRPWWRRRPWPRGRRGWARVGLLVALPALGGAGAVWSAVAMPGASHQGPPGPLPAAAAALPGRLRAHVERLAVGIGPRSESRPTGLAAAAAYIEGELAAAGLTVRRQPFRGERRDVANLVAERPGADRAGELVVVGAHYDTVDADTPGADDNASGVAALLELARASAGAPFRRTVRFVAFVNEESPAFQTETMGSLVAARASAAAGERVVAMLSLEAVGYYRTEPGSQQYPPPLDRFYPDRGDFIAFVGNTSSRGLVRRTLARFRAAASLPSEGASPPGFVPGVGWSDHWAYWQAGYPAVMVTDTAPFRNPHYHAASDLPPLLSYERMAWVVVGLSAVLKDLAVDDAVD